MNPALTEFLGYAAAGLVLVTFAFRSMTALRSVAIVSNLLFIAYAVSAELQPVLILHALLLPLNMVRLREALSESKCASDTISNREAAPDVRKPWPKSRRFLQEK